MKDLIKAYKWQILALVVILFIASPLYRFDKQTGQNSTPHHSAPLRTSIIIDSVKSLYIKEKMQVADSLTNLYESKLLSIQLDKRKVQASNDRLRKENADIRGKYENSPTPENCDSLVNSQQELITGLEVEIDTLNAESETYSRIIVGQKHRISLSDSLVITKQKMFNDCQRINSELYLQLEKKDNWWNRNHKWLFLGAGVFIGYKLF
jgi:hypothetical protein